MSRESRQRLREDAKRQENQLAHQKKFIRILPFLGIALIAVAAVAWIHFQPQEAKPIVAVQTTPTFK